MSIPQKSESGHVTTQTISTNSKNSTQLLQHILKHRARTWFLAIPVISAVILIGLMFLMPLNYNSETTLSIQQPGSSISSPLALLTGQAPAKKYLGILKSRRLAEEVEGEVDLQNLYSLTTKKKAVDKLMKCLKVEESISDGLVSIQVTLPGAPRLRGKGKLAGPIVAQKAADAANYFYSFLKDYYVNTDNERDTVLLRAAQKESIKAAASFDAAADRLKKFIHDLNRYSPRDIPASNSSDAQAGSANELISLYSALSKADTDLRSAQAGVSTEGRLTGEQLNNLQIIPAEDPLLGESRRKVTQTKAALDNLKLQFADDSPQVVVAQQKYVLAKKNLDAQVQGVRQNQTSDQVLASTAIEKLKARRETILNQIQEAEGRLPLKRLLTSDFEQLKNELVVRLEVRKTTETEFAKLRLSTVSAQSRISVVDKAIPADGGKPGLIVLLAGSVIGALTIMVIAISAEYSSLLRKRNETTG